jgi:hypothetical protein
MKDQSWAYRQAELWKQYEAEKKQEQDRAEWLYYQDSENND